MSDIPPAILKELLSPPLTQPKFERVFAAVAPRSPDLTREQLQAIWPALAAHWARR